MGQIRTSTWLHSLQRKDRLQTVSDIFVRTGVKAIEKPVVKKRRRPQAAQEL